MKNILPVKRDRLFAKAEDMAVGLHNHGAAIGVLHTTEVGLNGLLTTARSTEVAYQAARTGKRMALQTRRTEDKSGRDFSTIAKNVLKPVLGNEWSQPWAEVGFVNNSLKNPPTLAERITLLMGFQLYLTAHQSQENDQAGVTASAAADR